MSVPPPNLHPFAAAIMNRLQNALCEIYGGDQQTVMKYSDFDLNQKNIIRAVIEDAEGDCLMVRHEDGTLIYLNVWGIKSIIPVDENTQKIKDVYLDEEFNFKRRK